MFKLRIFILFFFLLIIPSAFAFCGDGVKDPGELYVMMEITMTMTTAQMAVTGQIVGMEFNGFMDQALKSVMTEIIMIMTTAQMAVTGQIVKMESNGIKVLVLKSVMTENYNDNDDCTNGCNWADCQDGIKWNQGSGTEECDDGNYNDNDDCTNGCNWADCQDGIKWNQGSGTEECDDGNYNDNDDCTTSCNWADCQDGIKWNQGSGTEECDDGNYNDNDDCTTSCNWADCQDGIKWNQGSGTEECDDGNYNDNDDCTNGCNWADCQDGIRWDQGSGNEECDDGNFNSQDDCTNNCEWADCGDGIQWIYGSGNEACDDGNGILGDGCFECQITYECSDTVDNDDDSVVDNLDPGCYDSGGYNPYDDDETDILPECSDFFDNDEDGDTDHPNDLGCTNPTDNDESDGFVWCSNNQDCGSQFNTFGCSNPYFQTFLVTPTCFEDGTEHSYCQNITELQNQQQCNHICDNSLGCDYTECSDGIDNDQDFYVDFPADSGCDNFFDDSEFLDTIPEIFVSSNVTQGVIPLSILFNCQGVGGNAPLSYVWDFGDNTFSTDQIAEHIYTIADNYTAVCTVTDNDGDHVSASIDITAIPRVIEITELSCFDHVIADNNQSCSIFVKNSLGLGEPDVDVTVYYLDGTLFGTCITDDISGGCEVKDPQYDAGNFTVYAIATKPGYENDTDTYPRFTYEVLAHEYEIENLKVFRDPSFLQEDYDFFRGEDMFVSFEVYRDGELVNELITNATLVSPPGGRADLSEITHNNGKYYYELRPIPLTHDFLGQSQVFTFAFNFSDSSGAESQVDLTIRNNLPYISPVIPDQELMVGDTIYINLSHYENDLEDSGNALSWSFIQTGANSELNLVGKLLFITGVSEGLDNINLILSDLDSDTASEQITITVTSFPECTQDSDCGTQSFSTECSGLDFLSTEVTPVCNLPGTSDSYCSNTTETEEESCNNICDNSLGCDYTECSDSIDNDQDSYIDFPDDLGCDNFYDNDESDGIIECNNNLECGDPTSEFGCSGLDYIENITIPVCFNPGTEQSFCDDIIETRTEEVCNNICDDVDGCDYTECSDSIDNDSRLLHRFPR